MTQASRWIVRLLSLIPVAIALTKSWSLNRSNLGRSNLKLKSEFSLKAKVGGIYEFSGPSSGSNPPPEIAELLGIKVKKEKKKSVKKANTAAITPNKPTTATFEFEKPTRPDPRDAAKRRKSAANADFSEKLEDLEKHVLAKYGSNAFKDALNSDVDWDEMDDEREDERIKKNAKAGKFEGFDPANRVKSAAPAVAEKSDKKDKKDKSVEKTVEKTDKKEKFSTEKTSTSPLITSKDTPGKKSSRAKVIENPTLENENENEFMFGAGSKMNVEEVKKVPLKLGLLARRKIEKSEPAEYSMEDMFETNDAVKEKKMEKDIEEEEDGEDDEGDDDRESNVARRDRRAKESTWVGQKGDLKPKTKAPFIPSSLYDYEGAEYDEDEEASLRQKLKESERSGPLNAVSGFRLRRPPPISPEEQKKLDAKAAALLAKEELQKEKRKMKKELEKNEYTPFEFRISESVDEFDQVFTTKSFMDIGVTDPVVLQNLERLNIFNPTKIQAASIPEMINGKDVLLHAQTGSGKTLAFLLPLLNTVDKKKKKVQAIILAPSRELVTQIGLVGESIFKGSGIGILSLIGGANVRNQIKRLRDQKPQIIVATPGRLAELVFQLRKLKLGMVRALVIDEVDSMLKEPFIGEILTIIESTAMFKKDGSVSDRGRHRVKEIGENGVYGYMGGSEDEGDEESDGVVDDNDSRYDDNDDTDIDIDSMDEEDDDNDDDIVGLENEGDDEVDEEEEIAPHLNKRLVCLASATINDPAVKAFADKYCSPGWSRVIVPSASMLPAGITHGLISTPRMRALEMLKKFLKAKPEVVSALIFVNDPHRVEIIYEKLLEMGFVAAPLHGESSKDDRKEIIGRLRDGRLNLVVTTELAARGLDIPDLTHVINFELPTDAQHYVHRAGRCGRAGRKGLVMNFANPDTKFVIRRFGKQLGVKVQDCEIRDGQVCLKAK